MRADGADWAGFRPGGRVMGEVRVPDSKSLAQRYLVAGALAVGRTELHSLPEAADVKDLCAALRCLGVELEPGASGVVGVRGSRPLGQHGEPVAGVGEAGTGARLLTAALALCGDATRTYRLLPRGTLARRSSPALCRALERAGARLQSDPAGGTWPVTITPSAGVNEVHLQDPGSSQEVTALLIALAAGPHAARLRVLGEIPSRPYVEMTLGVLRRFGVHVQQEPAGNRIDYLLGGELLAPAELLHVEPDASAAAVALAAACISDGEATVRGLDSNSSQGDVRIVEHLAAFGCSCPAAVGELRAAGSPRHGARLDLSGEPDLAPVLAAVGAVAAARGLGATVLTGLGTLPGKESSRIRVLVDGLESLGFEVDSGPAELEIRALPAPSAVPEMTRLDPHGDHRMVFAFALLGLALPGVRVQEPHCVAKSWPSFWDDLGMSGADLTGPRLDS